MNLLDHITRRLKPAVTFMARPLIPFTVLPVLMVILIAGTVAQRFIGLYDAQAIFFASLPVMIVMGVFTLSLLCKFLFFTIWSRQKIGINLSHLGILVLLIGGLMTALATREGTLTIGEGESASVISDYHDRTFTIAAQDAPALDIPFRKLNPGMTFDIPGTKATINVLETCRNCKIGKRSDQNRPYKSMAQFMALTPDKPASNDEQNINGVTFNLKGVSPDIDGTYLAIDVMPKAIEAGSVTFNLGKSRRQLPFQVRLKDFHAENHPGTAMARAYRSDVVIEDGGIQWPVRIEMNKPLRYKGYTFFQSSFFKPTDGDEYTVLAVVQNRAWLFPYIGTGLMAIGLLIHMLMMIVVRR